LTSWLWVALRPWEVAPHPNATLDRLEPTAAAALLMEARVFDYNNYVQEDSSLPPLGHSAESADDDGMAFVSFLGRYLLDDFTIADGLRDFASVAKSTSLQTLARVLSSLAYANSGSPSHALDVLYVEEEPASPLEMAYLLLHRGLRHFEQGDTEAALKVTSVAHRALAPKSATGNVLAVQMEVAALGNSANYRPGGHSGLGDFFAMQALARLAGTSQHGHRALEVVDELLLRGLDRKVRHPLSTSTRWTSEDYVVGPLAAFLVQAELSAQFGAIRAARRRLGRALLLDQPAGDARLEEEGSALNLIRRSGDVRLLESATEMVRRDGPLRSLREEIERFIADHWTPSELRGNLAFTRLVVDLCRADEIHSLAGRLLEEADGTVRLREYRTAPGWSVRYETIRAMSAIASVATDDLHERLSTALLVAIADGLDSLEAQAAADAVRWISWESLSPSLQTRWVRMLENRHDSEFRAVALPVLAELAQIGVPTAAGTLGACLEENFGAFEAAVLLDSALELREGDWWERIRSVALASVEEQLQEASAGRFSVGVVDPLRLLANVYFRFPEDEVWEKLEEALRHDSTALRKRALLERLASGFFELGEERRQVVYDLVTVLLRRGASDDIGDSVFGGKRLGEAALVRLWSLGGAPVDELLAHLAQLAADAGSRGRAIVAQVVGTTPSPSADLLCAVGMSISGDEVSAVRAEAGRSLGRLLPHVGGPLRGAVERRLLELLQEDGTLVPLFTLRGLESSPSEPIVGILEGIMAGHPSRWVRLEASRVLAK
jgi:hypothetical protein